LAGLAQSHLECDTQSRAPFGLKKGEDPIGWRRWRGLGEWVV
jgi:hypothetical protein